MLGSSALAFQSSAVPFTIMCDTTCLRFRSDFDPFISIICIDIPNWRSDGSGTLQHGIYGIAV
jgi:hypothetical protein